MAPSLTIANVADGCSAHAEALTERHCSFPKRSLAPDLSNVILGKWSGVMILASGYKSIFGGMVPVAGRRTPFKVVQEIVFFVTIAMVYLISSSTIVGWRIREECKSYEGLHQNTCVLTVHAENNQKVPARITWFQKSSFSHATGGIHSRNTADVSFVANLVGERNATVDNLFPSHRHTLSRFYGGRMA